MQISRAARREGGVALRKDRRKTISLSSDRCTVALDTPLVEVGLHDNESLGGGATRRGTKEGKSALTIVRISVGDREANRLPRSIPRASPHFTRTRSDHGIVVACFEYLFCYVVSGAFIISRRRTVDPVFHTLRSFLGTVGE